MKQAINAPRQNLFLVYPEDLLLIGRDTKDTPAHPRYDVRVHNQFEEDVVQGMMEYGVQECIKVVKNGDALEVVDGRQRTINAREANRRLEEQGAPKIRVKVIIVRGEDHRLAALTVLLNEHRVDDSAFGRGQKAQKLLDMGHPIESVAMFFKVSVATTNNYTSLLGLKPEIQGMIVEGKLPATKGYELAQKSTEAQQAFLDRKENGSRSGPPKRTPSKKDLRKLIEAGALPKLFLKGLQYALGDITEEELGKLPRVAPDAALEKRERVNPKIRMKINEIVNGG